MITASKIFPLLMLGFGLILISQVITPIATYKLWEIKFQNRDLASPYSGQVLGVSVSQDNFPAFVSDLKRVIPAHYSQFNLSIQKLGIKEAKVTVDSNDLDKGLALLPGTALPGERGNVFISGHSAVLFNNNFARLKELRSGDLVKVSVGETQLTYEVINTKVVDPSDLSVIEPPDQLGRYLSLMTCVPPGLNIKRLVVLAKLI